MGAIMAVGVGGRQRQPARSPSRTSCARRATSPVAAAIEAGRIRLRPIIMTALAMILGMLPMALGARRRRRAERAARPRRDRRPDRRDADDAVRRAGGLLDLRPERHRQARARRRDRRASTGAVRRWNDVSDDPRTTCRASRAAASRVGWVGAGRAGLRRDRGGRAGARAARPPARRADASRRRPRAAACWSRGRSTAPPTRALEVPATVRGYDETPVYAKIAGYLKTDRRRQGRPRDRGAGARGARVARDRSASGERRSATYELQQRDRRAHPGARPRAASSRSRTATRRTAPLKQAEATLEQAAGDAGLRARSARRSPAS